MRLTAKSSFVLRVPPSVISQAMEAAMEKAVYRTSAAILSRADEIVPVDTGELKASGKLEQDKLNAEVIYDSDHAVYPEFGTIHMAAQPYLRPALEAGKPILLENAVEEGRDALASL